MTAASSRLWSHPEQVAGRSRTMSPAEATRGGTSAAVPAKNTDESGCPHLASANGDGPTTRSPDSALDRALISPRCQASPGSVARWRSPRSRGRAPREKLTALGRVTSRGDKLHSSAPPGSCRWRCGRFGCPGFSWHTAGPPARGGTPRRQRGFASVSGAHAHAERDPPSSSISREGSGSRCTHSGSRAKGLRVLRSDSRELFYRRPPRVLGVSPAAARTGGRWTGAPWCCAEQAMISGIGPAGQRGRVDRPSRSGSGEPRAWTGHRSFEARHPRRPSPPRRRPRNRSCAPVQRGGLAVGSNPEAR